VSGDAVAALLLSPRSLQRHIQPDDHSLPEPSNICPPSPLRRPRPERVTQS